MSTQEEKLVENRQDVDDRYEKAYEYNEELKQIREKKQKRINKFTGEQREQHTPQNAALEGYVNNIKSREESIKIDVSILDNGEEHYETYTLDKPTSPEEYIVKNEFVRLMMLFADDDKDVTTLLERKIWIKKIDGNYELHIPDKTGISSEIVGRIHRWCINNRLASWKGSDSSNRISLVSKSVFSIGFMSLAIFMLSYFINEVGIRQAMADITIGSIFFSLIAGGTVVFHLATYESGNKLKEDIPKLTGLFLVIPLGLILVGVATTTEPSSIRENAQSSFGNIAHSWVIILSVILAVYYGMNPLKSISQKSKSVYNYLKLRYRSWKGVEYVRSIY